MAPCNCGGGSRPFSPSRRASDEEGQWVHRTMNTTTVYGTKREAEAAQRRLGGTITRV